MRKPPISEWLLPELDFRAGAQAEITVQCPLFEMTYGGALMDSHPKNEAASLSARRLIRAMTAASALGSFAAACSSAKSACCRESSA